MIILKIEENEDSFTCTWADKTESVTKATQILLSNPDFVANICSNVVNTVGMEKGEPAIEALYATMEKLVGKEKLAEMLIKKLIEFMAVGEN